MVTVETYGLIGIGHHRDHTSHQTFYTTSMHGSGSERLCCWLKYIEPPGKVTHPNTIPVKVRLTSDCHAKISFYFFNLFSETKITLNSITFCYVSVKITKWQIWCTLPCQGLLNSAKSGVAGLMVWEEYSMAPTSKLKKAKERKKHTPILPILMYRLHVPWLASTRVEIYPSPTSSGNY